MILGRVLMQRWITPIMAMLQLSVTTREAYLIGTLNPDYFRQSLTRVVYYSPRLAPETVVRTRRISVIRCACCGNCFRNLG